ncbi:MAG: uroporphyrinogen-III C-methyltransferase [Candidatus Brocadiia bacterium]|nr:uroporphyrinogen-III C-methyltransferase [Candidatus Brocadiia bacterium]
MSHGRVYLVGAGPGDPGLLTLRGQDLLSRADVVVYDNLVSPRILDHAPADAERIYVGKRASAHTLRQDEINQLLVERASAGADVVRLKGGDPFVFGRGGEEALALAEVGIEFEVVPGVTAAVAGAAYAGIPVTHRALASSLGLVTGHEAADKDDSTLDWQALARWEGTLVFYMGVGNLGPICKRLRAEGLDPQTPAVVIRWGTTPRQQVITAVLDTLPERAQEAGLKPPALIVIGKVVTLREKLMWFERRPLFGRRIIVTRARLQAGRLSRRLEALGAEVVELPTIRIEPPDDPAPLRQSVRELDAFQWIVFTSVNGVDAFFGELSEAALDSRALGSCKVCAIGPATAARLSDYGIRADAQPQRYTSAAVVDMLASVADLDGARILCPRADIAPREMPEALSACGALVREVTAYRTCCEILDCEQVSELFESGTIDWITSTSSSTVRRFFSAVDADLIRRSSARMASIGPATSQALRGLGFPPDLEADEHTIAGLVETVVKQAKPNGCPHDGRFEAVLRHG